MTDQIFVGVDVAKDWLDIHHASYGATRINNLPAAARSFAVRCAKEGAWVVFEASGGGRPIVRTILYLAAFQASRRSPEFIHFRERLQAAGKSVKTAIIATARKLVVTFNAMLASGTDYHPAALV